MCVGLHSQFFFNGKKGEFLSLIDIWIEYEDVIAWHFFFHYLVKVVKFNLRRIKVKTVFYFILSFRSKSALQNYSGNDEISTYS